MTTNGEFSNKQKIDELASQCVKCGLCLPHCPTYELTGDESESPRGRIALMQAIANDQIQANDKSVGHLSRCLSCRQCERVCPAHVQYGELLDAARNDIHHSNPKLAKINLKTRILSRIIASNRSINVIGWLLRMMDLFGLRKLGRYTGITYLLGLSRLDQLLPPVRKIAGNQEVYAAKATQVGRVAMFRGCLSRWSDHQTFEASIFVLQHLGYEVLVPKSQGCCGAMSIHHGDHETGKKLLAQNLNAFEQRAIDNIISTASGCGAMLKESHLYLTGPNDHLLSDKTIDISQFVLSKLDKTHLSALAKTVALHAPCTLRNTLKDPESASELLHLIPEMTTVAITDKQTCCGSAGSYMLDNPAWSDDLVQRILHPFKTEVDFIATSNIGCALHLRRALIKQGRKIKVVHPIVLVAMAMGWKTKFSKP